MLTKFSFAPFFNKELRASREFDLKKICLIFSCGKKKKKKKGGNLYKKLGKAKELLVDLVSWIKIKLIDDL